MRAKEPLDLDNGRIAGQTVAAEDLEFADLANLSTEKLDALECALTSILATVKSQETFAQIIDGQPTRSSFYRNYGGEYLNNPNISDRTEPSEHARQSYEKLRANFRPSVLKVEAKEAYQSSSNGSIDNELHLLEIAAASISTLAASTYKSFHPSFDLKPPRHLPDYHLSMHFYVDFYHNSYKDFEKYPFGLLNVVEYWAEAEIFGGVVFFDRGVSGSEAKSAFVHEQRKFESYQLSQEQVHTFFQLSTRSIPTNHPNEQCLLPFIRKPNANTTPTTYAYLDSPIQVYKNEFDRTPRIRKKKVREPGCVGTQEEYCRLQEATRKLSEAKEMVPIGDQIQIREPSMGESSSCPASLENVLIDLSHGHPSVEELLRAPVRSVGPEQV